MTNSMPPKRLGTEAEQIRHKFDTANQILKEANKTLIPIRPTKEVLEEAKKMRSEADKLISLLESGINKTNMNKIDEAARNVGRISLNIQQLTIKYRVDK